MAKRCRWFIVFIAVSLLIAYAVMIISIMPLIHDAESVFLNHSACDMYAFRRYCTSQYGKNVQRNATVIPLFAFHDNHKGSVYVMYSYEVRDKAGTLLSGARNVISKWEIAKDADGWKVIEIIEKP